jgi:hypothetical protein
MDTADRLRGGTPLAAVALFAGLAGVAGSYAAAGFTPAFVVAPIEGFVAHTMPGAVVTVAITVLGSLGQQLALAGAVALTATLFASLALAGLVTGRNVAARFDRPVLALVGPLLAGIVVWTASALLTGAPIESLGAGLGVVLVPALAEAVRLTEPADTDAERRSVLTGVAAAAGVGTLGGAPTRWPPPANPPACSGRPNPNPSACRVSNRSSANGSTRSTSTPWTRPSTRRTGR